MDLAAPRLVAFAAVFTVAEVLPSLRFFTDRLGFKIDFQMGDPPSYAIIERGAVSLHLMPKSQDPRGLGTSSVYVFVAGVDALHEELKGRGCPIEAAPETLSYGMREMSVRDPDGNRVTFGEEIKA